MRTSLKATLLTATLATFATCGMARAEPLVKDGDVLGIVGDSITEQKLYSVMMEDYLLMCQPLKVRSINFGWSGETVPGLNARIADVLAMKPTIVTTCYGMNDGHYTPITDEIRRVYRESSEKMVGTFVKDGIRVIEGSPGAVDTFSFKKPGITAQVYNANLEALSGEAKAVADETHQTFADVHTPMVDVMKQLKDKYGQNFLVSGGDGIHPNRDGHLIMAYAFLKAMGLDGNIGEYDVDLAAHTATATGGHKIMKIEGDTITIESTQYPFCFNGRDGDAGGTLTTTEFLPFNQDLNRLILKATGPAGKYKVTWGKASKTYTADELKAGVNLAADFTDNPFSETFNAINNEVQQMQAAETVLIKKLLNSLDSSKEYLSDQQQAVNELIDAIRNRDEQLNTEVHTWVKPVTHTLTIEAVQ